VSDWQICFLAASVWCGALVPFGLPIVARAAVVVFAIAAWRLRRPLLLTASLALLASAGAAAAWSDAVEPVAERTFVGEATLASDPIPNRGGVRVALSIEGRQYEASAWGSPAGWLRNRLMGEQVFVEARLRPLDDPPSWIIARGTRGRATIASVDGFSEGRIHTRIANSIRRTIESGASSMSRNERSLLTGLVYGDDRLQSPLTADNFTAAGLSHLLAVSGQNVAFVLALASPALRRLRHRQRFLAVLCVIGLFATVTRFEPSVVRASVMTGVAATGALVGTAVPARRVLLLAISVLVVVSPLIVHSTAFQLSLAASGGILLWSQRVALSIPGPRSLANALAVTATAQFAVAPLLLWRFDGLPVASLPANLLAGPAAGPVMMWGLVAGWLAGLVPGWLAEVLHVPTRLLIGWIDGVAALAARLPLADLDIAHVVVIGLAGAAALRIVGARRRFAMFGVVVGALLAPAVVSHVTPPPPVVSIDAQSSIVHRDGRVLVEVDPSSRPERVLAALRRARVGDIDLIIVRRSSFAMADLIGWIDSRHHVATVWAPELTMGVGEQVPEPGDRVSIGGSMLRPVITEDRLLLTVVGE